MMQMVHPLPQTPQGESVAKPGTLLLIILSLVCDIDVKEGHSNLSHPFFEKKVCGEKHASAADKCRNSIAIISY